MKQVALLALAALACSDPPGAASDAAAGDPLDGAVVAMPDAAPPDAPPGSCEVAPQGMVTLPADDAAHPAEPVEWWYWTGHLQAADGRWFGFESAFFSVTYYGQPGQMIHHAITDEGTGTFHYTSTQVFGAPAQVEGGFDLAVGAMTAVGGGGHDVLHGEVDGYVLDVTLDSLKAPVLQHGDGYTDYSFGGNTYYYSRERMAAAGTITVGGETIAVTGTGWFDHQYGDLNTAIDTGWDWFGIQLDDDREIMLFVVRASTGDTLVGGSLSNADCSTVEIGPTDFEITATGSFTTANGACTYPSGWTIRVNDLDLVVTPVLADQALDTAVIDYWEGAATVTGDVTGRAYVELTGYCP